MDSGMDGLDAMMAELTPTSGGGGKTPTARGVRKPAAAGAESKGRSFASAPNSVGNNVASVPSNPNITSMPAAVETQKKDDSRVNSRVLTARGRKFVHRLRQFHLDLADPVTRYVLLYPLIRNTELTSILG